MIGIIKMLPKKKKKEKEIENRMKEGKKKPK